MNAKLSVLIIDDDQKGAELLQKGIQVYSEMKADCIFTGKEGLKAVLDNNYDAVLLDLNLPGMNGLEVLNAILKDRPFCPVIMISGHDEIQTAVSAIKQGAFDYLIKPLDLEYVIDIINRSCEQIAMKKKETAKEEENRIQEDDLIIHHENSPLKSLIDMASKIASSDASILVTGESGTGKELFAKMIHKKSIRKNQPFITVNCAAIPEELIESEFFGHEKGAFTGAYEKREGLFSVADKGTIFLDEIGDIPLSMQVKLLRTLQSGELRKVGSNHIIHVNVRVLAATSKDLYEEVQNNCFREDLYYRLNVINLTLPPLRKRKIDIPCLIEHFIRHIHFGGNNIKGISKKALQILCDYHWPGNVRELKNSIERLMILSEQDIISETDVLNDSKTRRPRKFSSDKLRDMTLASLEEYHIKKILEESSGNKTKAARKLGITVQTLYNKLSKMISNE